MKQKEKPTIIQRLNAKGQEILSKIPKVVNVPIRRPVSEHQRFRQWLDAESKRANAQGRDTYEEFMDFGSDDENLLPSSEYELVFDPFSGREMLPREKIFLDAQRARYDQEQKKMRQVAKPAAEPSMPEKKAPKSNQGAKKQQQQSEEKTEE